MPTTTRAGTRGVNRLLLIAVLVLFFAAVVPRLTPQLLHPSFQHDRQNSDLRVPTKPPVQGQWRFLEKQGTRPVSYDPCHTIHYVVRVGLGPLNGAALVREAVDRVSQATGLRFEFDGMTDEVPQYADRRLPDQPVWIGWAGESETDLWAREGDVVGVAASAPMVNDNGHQVYVTGFAAFRPDNSLPPTFGAGETEGSVILHELGHVVGLDHVDDEREVMFGSVSHFTGDGYGPGDLRGLWELGASQGCL
jgi:hypothetical protein